MLPSSDPHSVDQSSCAHCNSYLRDLERGFQSHKFLVGSSSSCFGGGEWQGKELDFSFCFFSLEVVFVFPTCGCCGSVYVCSGVAKIEFFWSFHLQKNYGDFSFFCQCWGFVRLRRQRASEILVLARKIGDELQGLGDHQEIRVKRRGETLLRFTCTISVQVIPWSATQKVTRSGRVRRKELEDCDSLNL